LAKSDMVWVRELIWAAMTLCLATSISCISYEPRLQVQVENEEPQDLEIVHAKLGEKNQRYYVEIASGTRPNPEVYDQGFTLLLKAKFPDQPGRAVSVPRLVGFVNIDDIMPAWTGAIEGGWILLRNDLKSASGELDIRMRYEDDRSKEIRARITFEEIPLEQDGQLPERWFYQRALEREPGLQDWREELESP